ncbi:MAG: uL13 family ribosomal protein, partial [Oscillospiraceae bacterium]|nr:uL13 family ribosomal protein [Oscillospiraceae bacterium]
MPPGREAPGPLLHRISAGHHTGYIGGLKEVPYKKMMAEKSDLAVYEAVRGMLPKNSLGRDM